MTIRLPNASRSVAADAIVDGTVSISGGGGDLIVNTTTVSTGG